MKTFLKLIAGAFALVASTLALADGGVVTSVDGTATVQTGTGAPRPLRLGDAVMEGDTLATGPSSSVIVRFDDGQVVGLSSRSKLIINTYKYNPTAKSGNVLLSLVDGGMRALTGLIGKATPEAVTYKARTATIGIRGTEVAGEFDPADPNNFSFGVISGQANLTDALRTLLMKTGEGLFFRFGSLEPFVSRPFSSLNFSPAFSQFLTRPLPQPFQGAQQPADNSNTTTTNTPNSAGPAGSGGGGTASTR